MSASLMSCVRENSPPLDVVDDAHCSSAAAEASLSLQDTPPGNQGCQLTSTPLSAANVSGVDGAGTNVGAAAAATNTEPKRRRFHPLRKLGRIFRRRTITNGAETPPSVPQTLAAPTSSNSEKNLRSATLSSISSVVSASSPSSPLTHPQLQDAYSSQSLPKSKSYSNSSGSTSIKSPRRDALLASLMGKNRTQQQQQQQQQKILPEEQYNSECEMYTTTSSLYHNHQLRDNGSALHFQSTHHSTSMRQAIGVAVLPNAMNRSFYAERQKLRSVGDSSQELDSSGNDSGGCNRPSTTHLINGHGVGGARTIGSSASGGEMTDSQRSLSEGRLVDSDYCHDPLSQSHDSVFSESATASLFSNRDYQAELSDVLRKRNRNRPDASEEDLGLPRSPATPPRRANNSHRNKSTVGGHNASNATPSSNTTGNQSEVSSLSLLSMNSGDGDEILAASTANNSVVTSTDSTQERSVGSSSRFYTRSSTIINTSHTSSTTEFNRLTSSASFGSEPKDETDLFNTSFQRLSHSAAKHKMAVRPTKKKGPSRHHRRTLETSIPEANEDILKAGSNILLDTTGQESKVKARSLPPGVNAKSLDKHTETPKKSTATATVTPTKSKATTAASANSGGDQPISIKRTKLEKIEKADSDTIVTKTSSTPATNVTATNLFGLRAFSAKATALFDSSRESSTDPSPDKLEQPKESESPAQVENSESGFLRRLMQRNSKRSLAHTNNNSETDTSQSEPKKLQVSSSCFDIKQSNTLADLVAVEKSKSAVVYEQSIEETRKEIKREIMSVGTTGLSAMLNTYTLSSASSNSSLEKTTVAIKEPVATSHKPKSGPAARQRYVPQDIDTLERKNKSNNATNLSDTGSREEKDNKSKANATANILTKSAQQEIFQSTSIIREITASQALTSTGSISVPKPEHHFEKKPKIVGLSAFQQKISRSNDSFGRNASQSNSTSTSSNSLDTAGEPLSFLTYEQKQRKAVEKSRSFRTYQEEATSNTVVHNNMPSLPDLTLNLRVPCYNDHTFILQDKEYSSPSPPDPAHDRSISLGFEINDNNLVKTAPRAESTGHLPTQHSSYSLTNNVIVKTTPTKLLTPATMMPTLSPSNSCNQDLTEIEQNIDLLVKSPFISVLRKPTSTTMDEKPTAVTISNVNSTSNKKGVEKAVDQKQTVVPLVPVAPIEKEPTRPKVLHLKEATPASKDAATTPAEGKITPTTPAVPLREKSKLHSLTAALNGVDVDKIERKSAPSPSPVPLGNAHKATNAKVTKRSSSLMDSTDEVVHTGNKDNVPEFMKIQLHRVDPARMAKSANVVLAKNVREPQPQPQSQPQPQQQQVQSQPQSPAQPQQQPQSPQPQSPTATTKESTRTASVEELYIRRLSNESVEIIEKAIVISTEQEKPEKSRNSGIFDAISKQTKPNGLSYTRNNIELPPKMSPVKKPPALTQQPNTPTEEHVLLRVKPIESPTMETPANLASNKFSLQERKRLFMNEEKMKMEKKIEELRNERKRSITEEVYRKSFAKSEEKLETAVEKSTENVVMLRKKSFSAATQTLNGHATTTNSNNNNNNNANNNGSNGSITSGTKDDHTPELMKVFARRSLKIKDEDITALSEKILANSAGHSGTGNGSGKKFSPSQQNVDSDKENQSASEEKLDKLPKIDTALEQHAHTQPHANGKLATSMSSHHHHNGINNRNSLADFRNTTALTPKCGNNSNNNNNNSSGAATAATTTAAHNNSNNAGGVNNRSFLPPIKVVSGGGGGGASNASSVSCGSAFRNMPIERNASVSKIYGVLNTALTNNNNNSSHNNNNNSNNNNHLNNNNNNNFNSQQQNGKAALAAPYERQSLNIKLLESSGGSSSSSSGISATTTNTASTTSSNSSFNHNSKTIERSATVSEFKGIHQRRAEWEQRAKEALK